MDRKLNNSKWKLQGFWPYVPFQIKGVEPDNELMGVTDWIDAEVPGSIYRDLFKAGLIQDPYFECNSLNCEWVSNRWWLYKTAFKFENTGVYKKILLIFKGIDYKAHFHVNSVKVGEHEGMHRSAVFDVTGVLKADEENELCVLFESAPEEMSQLGYTSNTCTQKSRFNYKWDFGTRLVNLGIYDDALIRCIGNVSIEEMNVQPDIQDETGLLDIQASIYSSCLNNTCVKYELYFDNSLVYEEEDLLQLKEGLNDIYHIIEIRKPELWYPNGSGQQPLYRLEMIVHDRDGISDSKSVQTGFRTLKYERNEGAPQDSLPYTIIINGRKIYIKGVNMVPADHMYGCVDEKGTKE